MGTVYDILKGDNGELYIGSNTKGVFRSSDGGQNWMGLGGNTIMVGRINALTFNQNDKLLAATEQGGVKIWDGTSWTNLNMGLPVACGITIPIRTLVVDSAGNYYAGAHRYSICFSQGDLYRFDGNTWTSIATGLTNRDINALAIHPITGQLFAGTDGGGVFQYDGLTWTASNANLLDTVVNKLLFSPNGDLYAGTNKGLAKLTFGSNVWLDLSNGLNGAPVRSIALEANGSKIVVGTGYNLEQSGSLFGQIFESQDGGLSWLQIGSGIQTTAVNDLVFLGNDSLLAAGWGLFKSTDQGTNWLPANQGFSAKGFNTYGRIAVSPEPDRAIFYGTDNGVFKSTDEGLSWKMASQGLERSIVTLLHCDSRGNLFCGVARFLNEGISSFGGDGLLYKSSDNGEHWYPVTISKDWRYLEISELENGDLICAHGFGAQPPSATITGSSLARSSDEGETWTDLNIKTGLAYCCTSNAAGDMFVAGESQSVYRSTDGGNAFDLIQAPGQSGNVTTLETAPNGDLFMSSGGQRTLFYSTDNGSSYQSFDDPLLPDYRGAADVVFDDQNKAYCSTSGQNGIPSLFTISPPFAQNSPMVAVPGIVGSLFKMVWDDCGYLYIYRPVSFLKSSVPLRPPGLSCLPSSVISPLEIERPTVSPNPGSDYIQLKTVGEKVLHLEFWSSSGWKVLSVSVSKDEIVPVQSLPVGMYLLKVKMENGSTQCIKWVKV